MLGYHLQEGVMRTLIITAAVLLMVPMLRAQQAEADKATPQVTQQEATENPQAQSTVPDAIKPGHPLDPADVDILTGKRDREIEASRSAAFYYGAYGDFYAMNGRRGTGFDLPFLPLTRIGNPFLLSILPPRGFGRGGFRGRR
jgi:hypothetical protein